MVQKTLEEKRLESRIEKLRKKQDDLEEAARESKKRIQALKRKKKQVLTRQVRRAQARLNTHERRRRTRRLILIGTLLEHQVSHSEEAQSRLRHDLDVFLKRDRDRELFDLPPLAEPVPDSSAPAPDLDPSSPALPPLRGWSPARLPDGNLCSGAPSRSRPDAEIPGSPLWSRWSSTRRIPSWSVTPGNLPQCSWRTREDPIPMGRATSRGVRFTASKVCWPGFWRNWGVWGDRSPWSFL